MYSPMDRRLTTERLLLRPLAEPDLEPYREMITERGEPRPTEQDARSRVARQHRVFADHGFSLLAVELHATGEYVGYCGIVIGRSSADEPEIAYELLQRFHRHGYATEAARAVLDAITATGRTRLWSTVRSWNAASFRVLDKIGFARDHVTVDEKGEVVWLTRPLP